MKSTPLTQRQHIRQNDRSQRVEAAAADAGDGPRENELVHRLREPAEQAAGSKHPVGEEEEGPPPEDVAEFAV